MTREFPGGVLRPVLAGGLLAASMAFACPTPASADWLGGENPVTTGTGTEQWPQLSGSRLVYTEESEDGGFDVRVRDLATGTDRAVTTGHSATGRAAISGNRVVWADSGTQAGVWVENLATEKRRRLSVGLGDGPSISGGRVCYTALGRVHVYDLRAESDEVVSSGSGGASNCDISGDVVVWQDDRSGDADIFSYDLRTRAETRITSETTAQTMPRVDGDLVVWQDDPTGTGDTDIRAADLTTGAMLPICDAAGAQSFPEVSQGRVVWTDARYGHGSTAVFLYDRASGVTTRVTSDVGWSAGPTISGSRIVYEGVLSTGHHLFERTIVPPLLTVALTSADAGNPSALSGRLTRTDGVPMVGVTVHLESSGDGQSWIDTATAITGGDGGYAFALTQPLPSWLRVRFGGAQDAAPVVSEPVLFEAGR